MKLIKSLVFIALLWSSGAQASTSFYYYSKVQRVDVLKNLFQTVKARYSLWEIKLLNMGIDGDKLFEAAILNEQKFNDVASPVDRARSNMNFHDRVKKLIATFEDTHFSARENTRMPNVANGMDTRYFIEDGKTRVLVSSISKKIMALNENLGGHDEYKKIKLGDRVIKIDGKRIEDQVQSIKAYVAASSKGFRIARAIENLSRRNFQYPSKNYSDWVFETGEGDKITTYKVRLPWYVDKTNRRDANLYFAAKKFKKLDKAYFKWDEKDLKWEVDKELLYEGYSKFDAPKGIIGDKEWHNQDELVLRTGYYIKNNKSYGYIQFFAFTNSEIFQKSDEKAKSDLPKEFRAFVKELKENKTPLIVDIRTNFGGNTAIAIENLASIAKKDEAYPSRTVVFKTTQYIQSLLNAEEYDPSVSEMATYGDFEMVMREFDHAVSIGKKYTGVMLQTDPITAHEDIGGYELPVVAMVSPWCISACDNQSFLFKHSKRVTLIGEPANGTGAGFYGNSTHDPSYVDPSFIVRTRIPNYLFGLPLKTTKRVLGVEDVALMLETNSENKATTPHIEFNYTMKSYMDKGADWIDKAVETIDKAGL
jgi:C-terminal processing protease CtpA/Prc